MAVTTTTASNFPCQFYFVKLDEKGRPIVGTQFAKGNNQLDDGYNCREGRLTPYQMVAPAGYRQCFPDNDLRYFYKVNNLTGKVLQNSMWSQRGKPNTMCSGQYKILEYKIFSAL